MIIVIVIVNKRKAKNNDGGSDIAMDQTNYRPVSTPIASTTYTGLESSLPLSQSGKPIIETSNRNLLEKKVNIDFTSLKMEKEIGNRSLKMVLIWDRSRVLRKVSGGVLGVT